MPEFEVVTLREAMLSLNHYREEIPDSARVCQLSRQPAPRRGWQTHTLSWRNR